MAVIKVTQKAKDKTFAIQNKTYATQAEAVKATKLNDAERVTKHIQSLNKYHNAPTVTQRGIVEAKERAFKSIKILQHQVVALTTAERRKIGK